MNPPLLFGTIGTLMLAVLTPRTALAHGFGDRYDLPVPLGLYLSAAGAAVVLSFVVIAMLAKRDLGVSYPQKDLLQWQLGRVAGHPATLAAVRGLSVFVVVVYLQAGLFGTDDPNANLVPTMTWVIFWVGIAYVSALVGDIWSLINPWKIIFGYVESLVWKLTGRDIARYEPYPARLSAWPAVALFFAFAWIEVVYTGSDVPFNIAMLVFAYSMLTFIGMWWFGRDEWLHNGEVFTIVFGFFAAFAPTHATEPDDDDFAPPHGFVLRPWGVGLLSVPKPELSRAALLVLMLASVSFDGFVETATWTELLLDLHLAFSFLGANAFSGITTVGLLVAPLLFFGVFALTAWLMGWLAQSPLGVTDLIRTFVFSLVPIALAYHIAHFFSFLVIQGQRMIPLISDPYGWGWNLFGTADYTIDISVVNARFMWYLSIAAIVIGHIIAVYVAHVYALRTFPGKGEALRSQYPMLALMTGYTMVSLWIVAQPIMEI